MQKKRNTPFVTYLCCTKSKHNKSLPLVVCTKAFYLDYIKVYPAIDWLEMKLILSMLLKIDDMNVVTVARNFQHHQNCGVINSLTKIQIGKCKFQWKILNSMKVI